MKINEKAVSQAQQRLMAQALSYKIGKTKAKDLDPKYKEQIIKLADSMSQIELEKFASTKRKGLPKRAKKEIEEDDCEVRSYLDKTLDAAKTAREKFIKQSKKNKKIQSLPHYLGNVHLTNKVDGNEGDVPESDTSSDIEVESGSLGENILNTSKDLI